MGFSKAIILARFYANQDFISKNLCENRNKPGMHCCGKCLLKKKLSKENNRDMNSPDGKNENKYEVLSSLSSFAQTDLFVKDFLVIPYKTTNAPKTVDRSVEFFHPPNT